MKLAHLAAEFEPESLLTQMLIQGAIEEVAKDKDPESIEMDGDLLFKLYQLVNSNRKLIAKVMGEFGILALLGGNNPQQEAANLIQAKMRLLLADTNRQ